MKKMLKCPNCKKMLPQISPNKVESRWRTFYYAPGMGFETGNKVYVGRNDWNTEASAITAQQKHEERTAAL